jgi:hypothetical protein
MLSEEEGKEDEEEDNNHVGDDQADDENNEDDDDNLYGKPKVICCALNVPRKGRGIKNVEKFSGENLTRKSTPKIV